MDNLGLFTECTRYNDKATSENRLTQVFAAAFNYSSIVRKVFFDLIGYKKPHKEASIATQQQEGTSSRPDMLVYLDGCLQKFIVVESKTDLKQITKKQLNAHKSFAKKKGNAEEFVLISRYRYNVPDGWTSVLWYDFAQNLAKVNSRKPQESIDYFVCRNFVDFLKEYGYMKSTCITIEDFTKAAKCIINIRKKKTPSTSVNELIYVQKVSDFLSFCMEYVNQNSGKISEKVKRRKMKAPVFGFWYENNEPSKSKITLCVKQKINNMRNGADYIGFMLQQKDNFHCSLSLNLWKKSNFTILAEWSVKETKDNKFFKVWRLSTNRESCLGEQLLVCDVANLAINEWNGNYSKGAGGLDFNKHG